MAHKLLLAALLFLVLIFYVVFIKEKPTNIDDVTPIQKSTNETIKKQTKTQSKLLEKKAETTEIELIYYNLFLNQDYTKLYNNEIKTYNYILPQLENKKHSNSDENLNIELTPEFIFDKENNEIGIDKLRIQLEKKF
jgi:predicted acetyltransferase